MKVIAVVCILSVTLCSCASVISHDQYGNITYDKDAYRDRQIAAAIVGVASLVLLVVFLEESKKQRKATMDSWVGSHVSKLIRSWGPPHRVVSDGTGGKIYIWSSHVKIPWKKEKREGSVRREGNTLYYKEKTSPAENIEYDKVRMFWVNSRGIVYHWRAKGL